MDEAGSVGSLGHLTECRRYGERAPEEESHSDGVVKVNEGTGFKSGG